MAINLVMFPSRKLGMEILKGILKGGHEKVVEAGACLSGGHSVDDDEPKYGLAVTGVVSPDRILTNSGAKPGDALVLTKPLGTGVLFNAHRSGKLPWHELEPILPQVAALNRIALEIALNFDIHACTDITGFGILGHVVEMSGASGVGVEIEYAALPLYPNATAMYRKGETTGSNKANRKLVEDYLQMSAGLLEYELQVLYDPQTSGGLLFSLPEDQSGSLVEKLRKAGVLSASVVGRVLDTPSPVIRIV